MSKYIKITLFLLLILLFKVQPVSARFYGSYRYDIDSASITDTSITFRGWAAINDGGSNELYLASGGSTGTPVDNINPTYTLTVNAINGSGSVIETLTFNSEISTNDDYTRNWYDYIGGVTNYTYRGINYQFTIPVSQLKSVVTSKPSVNHFELVLNVKLSNGYTKSININFQSSVVTNTSTTVSIANELLTSVRAIVVQGRALNTSTIGGDVICYDSTTSKYYSTPSDVTCTRTSGVVSPSDHAYVVTGSTYSVTGRSQSMVKTVEGANTGLYINSYAAYGSVSTTSFYDYNGQSYKLMPGSANQTYIPSAWIIPAVNNSIWLSIGQPNTPPNCSQGVMQCYCATYPTDTSFCTTIDDQNNGADTRSSSCASGGTTTLKYQQPKTGYGVNQLTNRACKIDCQEDLEIKFQSEQYLKAGTGFTYPVGIKSTRYCTAQYSNSTWQSAMNKDVTDAISAYNSVVSNVNSAKTLDTACGTKKTVSIPRPTQTYTLNLLGQSSIPSGYGCSPYKDAKGVTKYNCTKLGCSYTSGNTCYIYSSCPSGYTLSGSSCVKDVCSKSGADWGSAQSAIQSKIDAASSSRNTHNALLNDINSLNNERAACDSYAENNTYQGATSTTITTTGTPNQTQYRITDTSNSIDGAFASARKKTTTNYTIYLCTMIAPPPPTLSTLVGGKSYPSSLNQSYCKSFNQIVKSYNDFWNKKSDASVSLEFNNYYYVQTYTGTLSTTNKSGYVGDGYKSYSSFYDMSQNYPFSLVVKNMGPNLPVAVAKTWSVNPFSCSYNVDNLIFPPKGDSNYDKYGSIGFSFRQVSLRDPFPNRSARENWRGKETLITSKGYNVYATTPLYTITLTPATMQNIRGFKSINNNVYGYSDASNPANSKLIDQYSSVIVKRK